MLHLETPTNLSAPSREIHKSITITFYKNSGDVRLTSSREWIHKTSNWNEPHRPEPVMHVDLPIIFMNKRDDCNNRKRNSINQQYCQPIRRHDLDRLICFS